jgi:hypothetical protein
MEDVMVPTKFGLLIVIAVLVGAACNATSTPSAPTASASAAAGGQNITVDAKEFGFDLPSTIPTGIVNITVTNSGKEEHQAQLAKIADGKTMQEVVAALAKQDFATALSIITFVGGPTGVAAGGTQTISANLAPGNYMAICFVTSDDGVPHFAKGMVAAFSVTGTASAAQLPAASASLTLQDFSFVGIETLPTGPQVVAVTNKGPQPHEATIVKLDAGVTADQARSQMAALTGPATSVPFSDIGGIAAIAANSTANVTINLPPGNYAFVCYVPDPASGKGHFQLGMIGGLTVK